MNDAKITVIMPTFNRLICIDFFLNQCLASYKGKIFKFEILDSSTNNETQKAVDEFLNKHRGFPLMYYRFDSNVHPDIKVENAIRRCKTDYFYVFGDGNLVDFNILEKVLLQNDYSEIQVINIEPDGRRELYHDEKLGLNRIYKYDDDVLFTKKYFSHMTYWGATIISMDFFRKALYEQRYFEKYKPYVWWLPCCIVELLNYMTVNGKNVRLGVIYSDIVEVNPHKKDHSWTQSENYYLFVFKYFQTAVDLLPNRYECVKEDMIKFFRDDALVTKSFLIHQRQIGVLQYVNTKKYRQYIDRVDGYYDFMLFLSYVPVSMIFLVRLVYKVAKRYIFIKGKLKKFLNIPS